MRRLIIGAALAAGLLAECDAEEKGRVVAATGCDVPKAWEPIPGGWASNVARGVRIAKKDTVTPALFAEYYAASEHPGTR